LTPIKRFYCIYEKNFSLGCIAGFVGWAIFCTNQQLHYPFADVLSSENISDKKSIDHTLSLKEGFCGVMGYVFRGHSRKKETIEYV